MRNSGEYKSKTCVLQVQRSVSCLCVRTVTFESNELRSSYPVPNTIRYDTRCYFSIRSKADIVSLIYCREPKTKKWKTEKLKSKKTEMLRSIGKQSGASVESVLKSES